MTQPDQSRAQLKKQKRRTNIVINVAIGVVLLAVVVVAYQVFSSPTPKEARKHEATTKREEKKVVTKKEELKREETKQNPTQEPADKKIMQETRDEKVAEAYTNPAWKPTATTQNEPHITSFDDTSIDWKEMIQTISTAIHTPVDTFTILHLGNNGSNKAIGTVLTKDTKQTYKVYLEWTDNKGWLPTLVQKMK